MQAYQARTGVRPGERGGSREQTSCTEGGKSLLGKGVVLLADDDSEVRSLTRRLLQQLGFIVLEAANGSEAVEVAERSGLDRIDLLVTDVFMPLMGGVELAARLRIAHPSMGVLFISGSDGDCLTPAYTPRRGTRFLQKPFGFAALQHEVYELLGNCRNRRMPAY